MWSSPSLAGTLGLAILLVALSACTGPPTNGSTTITAPGSPAPPSPTTPTCPTGHATGTPDLRRILFLQGGEGALYRYDWSANLSAFTKTAQAASPWGGTTRVSAVTDGAFVYAVNDTTLTQFDLSLKPLRTARVDRPMAMAAWAGQVALTSNGTLQIFDDHLARLSQLALNATQSNPAKIAHGILVNNGTAYLVDDVALPFFAFRVDVRDPRAPSILSKQEISVVNGHIGPQWLDRARNQWLVQAVNGGSLPNGRTESYELRFLDASSGSALATKADFGMGAASATDPRVEVGLWSTGAYATLLKWTKGDVVRACNRSLGVAFENFGQVSVVERESLAYAVVGRALRIVHASDLVSAHRQDLDADGRLVAIL